LRKAKSQSVRVAGREVWRSSREEERGGVALNVDSSSYL
jgi:hypothetical protein